VRQPYITKEIFPVKCYSFNAPEQLTPSVLEECKKLQYKSLNEPAGVGTSDEIQYLDQFQEMHQWFQHCVDTLHVDNGWEVDRLVVNKTWANRSDAHSMHHHAAHRHPMSYLSGIYYLTGGTPTVFLDPIDKREWGQFKLDGGLVDESLFWYHGGIGGLIIFPSYIVHASEPNNSEFDRYTIAFNTFPTGHINSGAFDRSMANVTVKGWSTSDLGPLKLSDFT